MAILRASAIQQLFHRGTCVGLVEAELLDRFVTRRDETAFEALVARFGPMVLGVCRRSLDNPHDIDDAFQATFLIFVKKARSIRDGNQLGPWLYGVAFKVASRARTQARQRHRRETSTVEAIMEKPVDIDLRERHAILDAELNRLPEKYRKPIILCYLQGQTHDEAAARLRWPVGTVRSRLARGRDLLRDRLTRRGMASPGVAFALETACAPPAVPIALMNSTIQAGMQIAAGSVLAGTVSAGVASLSEGVLTSMKLSTWKWVAGLVLALSVAGGAGATVLQQGADSPADQTAESLKKELSEARKQIEQARRREAELNERLERLEKAAAASSSKTTATADSGVGSQNSANGLSGAGASNVPGAGGGFGGAGGGGFGRGPGAAAGGFGGPGVASGGGPGGSTVATGGAPGMAGGGMPGGMAGRTMGGAAMGGGGGYGGIVNRNYLSTGVVICTNMLADRKLSAYSVETGRWKTYEVPEGTDKATPIASPNLLALVLEGPAVTRIAAFDSKSGEWTSQELREPTTKATPIVGPSMTAYGIGRFAYAFSVESGKWDTLELEEGAKAIVSVGTRWVTVEHGGKLHVYSGKTGTWSSSDVKPSK